MADSQEWNKWLAHNIHRGTAYVARDSEDRTFLGGMCLSYTNPEAVTISWLAVDPRHRRRGAGTELIETAVQESGGAPLRVITFGPDHPHPEAAAALKLYRELGFEASRETPPNVADGTGRMVLIRPVKSTPLVQVVAGLLRRERQVLLCHRTPDRSHYPDVWDLPGGRVEPGETLIAALARELQEELGIMPNLTQESAWLTLTDDNLQLHIYLVDDWLGEPTNLAPDEHDEIRWTSVGEISDLDLADSSYGRMLEQALT